MTYKALVLLSGGLDSATCLSVAINEFGKDNISAVSIFYGQKHSKELKCANDVAKYYGIKYYKLDLSEIFKYSNCSLLSNSTEKIPEMSYEEQIKLNGEGKVSTYVPFRNGLMLSAAASLAQSLYPNDTCYICIGAHKDDAAGDAYADCSSDFLNYMRQAINIGTYNKVKVYAPFVHNTKAQIVLRGTALGTPYQLTTSCYEGKEKACGKCGTCIDRLNAFKANGLEDPIEYEDDIEKKGPKLIQVSWNQVDEFINNVEDIIKYDWKSNYCGVYGPPRGGLPLAVMLSHRLNIPLLQSPCENCLIVDDITDTGETLHKYYDKGLDIITMYYCKRSSYDPLYYMYEKDEEAWVVFPWEK